ncbi:MAG: 4Fe-4S binding protein [Nitrospirae bacterium]|nr:4Fe-4S binding protein [Nitrospirota bacterium]
MKLRIHTWRRLAGIVQAVIIIGLPFLRTGGESALRFDIPSLTLHFFGAGIWMEDFFIVLVAVMFVTLLLAFITLMFGRIWCGWACPQTVLIDFTPFADKMKSGGIIFKSGAYALIFFISVIVSANLIWYFVSPYEFIGKLTEGGPGNVTLGFWVVMSGILFLNFAMLRHTFCATVCPYAKLQSVLFDDKTLVISFDPRRKQECMKCMACVRTCPVGIDIREGSNAACISCAQCIDACTNIMERSHKKSLIGYFFGLPGTEGRLLRRSAAITGSASLAFLIFFIYLVLTHVPLDMTILPNYSYPPRITADGGVINSYILSLKNRGRSDAEIDITAAGKEGVIKLTPDSVHLSAGGLKKLPVYVQIDNIPGKETPVSIDISIRSKDSGGDAVVKKANFIIP